MGDGQPAQSDERARAVSNEQATSAVADRLGVIAESPPVLSAIPSLQATAPLPPAQPHLRCLEPCGRRRAALRNCKRHIAQAVPAHGKQHDPATRFTDQAGHCVSAPQPTACGTSRVWQRSAPQHMSPYQSAILSATGTGNLQLPGRGRLFGSIVADSRSGSTGYTIWSCCGSQTSCHSCFAAILTTMEYTPLV